MVGADGGGGSGCRYMLAQLMDALFNFEKLVNNGAKLYTNKGYTAFAMGAWAIQKCSAATGNSSNHMRAELENVKGLTKVAVEGLANHLVSPT